MCARDVSTADQRDDGTTRPFPSQLLAVTKRAGRLRYFPTEDHAYVVFLGHPPHDHVLTAAAIIAARVELDADLLPTSHDDVLVTSAWLRTSCPIHDPSEVSERPTCVACWATEEDWQLLWDEPGTDRATPADTVPPPPLEQRFAVTVWDTHAY